nr:MAG TPA: hypothetical protein [Caudoviricetes sp.]
MIERVSSHFRYTEEYVLDHTFGWLKRKCLQADREQYERRKMLSDETMRGTIAALSAALGGKHAEKELLPEYEQVMQQDHKQAESKSEWVTGQWWKQKPHK